MDAHPDGISTIFPLPLRLPFDGRWVAGNSPARRVPSHGTDLFGSRFAIDFVAVDDRRRTAIRRDWRAITGSEPPELFLAFGRPVLAPTAGTVVVAHDGEEDHLAHRSPVTGVPYLLGQRRRALGGAAAIAGNHGILHVGHAYVAVVHLQRGSVVVREGQDVAEGEVVAGCGNSGNSTQPHVHVQAMTSLDLDRADGLPIAFTNFREWRRGRRRWEDVEIGMPQERSIVEARSLDA